MGRHVFRISVGHKISQTGHNWLEKDKWETGEEAAHCFDLDE